MTRVPCSAAGATAAALIAALTGAAVLLPASGAAADTTIRLTEDGERFLFFDETGPLPVAAGSTLVVPPAPTGAAWETGVDLVLVDLSELEPFGDLELEGLTDLGNAEEPGELGDPVDGPDPEAVAADLDEVSRLAAVEEPAPGIVVAGTIEDDTAVPGGVRAVLDPAVPEGTYLTGFVASGPGVEVQFVVTLEVAAGDPADVTLDYSSASFSYAAYLTMSEQTVPTGSRVTLTAPPGVDLSDFEIGVLLPYDETDLELPFYLEDELGVERAADGSSISFVVPSVLPREDGDTPPAALPDGTALEVVLSRLIGDELEGPLSVTEYVVIGLEAGNPTSASTSVPSTPRIPTAVPAGDGSIPGDRGGVTGTGAVLPGSVLLAIVLLGLGAFELQRRRQVAGTHR
jgi:hypothetical protein